VTDEKKPTDASLIAEYNVLNNAVASRSSAALRLDSIMIPSSIAVLVFAVQFRVELGKALMLKQLGKVPSAGSIPLLALILVVIPFLNHWTANKLDEKYFERINEIEKILCIEGRHSIYNNIRDKRWFKIRLKMWKIFFGLLILVYLAVSAWLFYRTTF